MYGLFRLFLFCLALIIGAGAAFAQKRGITLQPKEVRAQTPYAGGFYRALLIGNNVYRDRSGHWPSLTTAVADARALSQVLQRDYGFSDVELLENATRRDILLALDRLSDRALPDDNILVYYAGHGFIDEDDQRGYWVPVDAQGTDQTTFLRNSTIRDELNLIASRARHTLLISDSCFSGSLLRPGSRGISASVDSEQYFRKVSARKSVQIMAAGGLEYVDDDYRDSGHSPFSYFLLNELKHNDQPLITLSELSNNVTRAVANNVEQVPASGVLHGAGDELGEFIFIKLDVVVEGVDPDKVDVQVNVLPGKPATDAPAASVPNGIPPGRDSQQKPHVPMPTL